MFGLWEFWSFLWGWSISKSWKWCREFTEYHINNNEFIFVLVHFWHIEVKKLIIFYAFFVTKRVCETVVNLALTFWEHFDRLDGRGKHENLQLILLLQKFKILIKYQNILSFIKKHYKHVVLFDIFTSKVCCCIAKPIAS